MRALIPLRIFLSAHASAASLSVALLMLLGACGRNESTAGKEQGAAPSVNATETATAGSPLPEPSKEGLKKLCSDTNPYIRNNAKQGLSAWEARDYTTAVISMQKIITLCKSEAQQADAISSLAQLKKDVEAAAAKGNRNAKEAAAQLEQVTR